MKFSDYTCKCYDHSRTAARTIAIRGLPFFSRVELHWLGYGFNFKTSKYSWESENTLNSGHWRFFQVGPFAITFFWEKNE